MFWAYERIFDFNTNSLAKSNIFSNANNNCQLYNYFILSPNLHLQRLMLMNKYARQTRMLVAVDCIVFGFDASALKILLIKRGFEPEKGKWSLMGGFVQPEESLDNAAQRILAQLTGLTQVYVEQLKVFGNIDRDPIERTLSVTYFALLDLKQFKPQLTDEYHAEWFDVKEMPELIFDHEEMVINARHMLRYKASMHPIFFELLPAKFTIPQMQRLFEEVYETSFDKGNFSRKMLSTNLITKLPEKDKTGSKKGAFFYKLNKNTYKKNFQKVLHLLPNRSQIL